MAPQVGLEPTTLRLTAGWTPCRSLILKGSMPAEGFKNRLLTMMPLRYVTCPVSCQLNGHLPRTGKLFLAFVDSSHLARRIHVRQEDCRSNASWRQK